MTYFALKIHKSSGDGNVGEGTVMGKFGIRKLNHVVN